MNTDQGKCYDEALVETAEHREQIQQFEAGRGDHTAERHTWLGKRTVRELVEEIERQRKTQ